MATLIEEQAVVIFQGDSITDAGRIRQDDQDLGCGYAMMIAAWFSAQYPERNVRFINRGISGNRARDLRARWRSDCIELKPTWVSILIGINDTWRRYDSQDPTATHEFEDNYRAIIERLRETSQARLILCEPFVVPVSGELDGWREDLDPKIMVVRRLAREFKALLVPLDGIFAQATTRREPAFWAADGVHPSPAGHALIAQAWLRATSDG